LGALDLDLSDVFLDDHTVMRAGVVALLASEPGIEVVAERSTVDRPSRWSSGSDPRWH
jgi:DNA-binding NarL/FixJ family response regulator